MNVFKKFVCLWLALMMVFSVIPLHVFASDPAEQTEVQDGIYTIQNDFVRYSLNAETGGFSVETLDGNPQKYLDDNLPLLYREDASRSNGTSFTTVRIDGKDYIFGRDYNHYGIATELGTPVVSNDGRLLTVSWKIMDYTVLQQVALSAEADQDLTGNVGISYTVLNNGDSDAVVGIRVLLDTALDSTVDAPYMMYDEQTVPIRTETEFSAADGTLPAQIRGLDSLSSPSKMLYALTKTWNNAAAPVDRIIVGHWRNLANTRYDYTPNAYCDFSNYSNQHRTPDAAVAYYWDEAVLGAGQSRVAELLYGVGNFSQSVVNEGVGINMVIDNKVRLNADETGYLNDGVFTVTVSIDNSVDGAQQLESAILTLSYEDGITPVSSITQALDTVEQGDIKTFQFTLQAAPQDAITAKAIGVTLTASQNIDEATSRVVTLNTQRSVVLPGIKGAFSGFNITGITPEIVFTEGAKTLTVTGTLESLKAIEGTDGWKAYFYHKTSDHKVEISKSRIAFMDEACTQMTFSTDETLEVGSYEIGFEFTDTQLVDGFGAAAIRFGKTFDVSNNPIYRSRSYGLMALIRYNTREYAFVPFTDQQEYNNFLDGLTRTGGVYTEGTASGYTDINGNAFAPFDPVDENNPATLLLNEKEVILIMRAPFREVTADDGSTYYQASPEDGDVIINEILKYTGDKPLVINENGGLFSVSGNGHLGVISSIAVWDGKWSFQVNSGTVTTLDEDRCQVQPHNALTLSLGGVGYMVQSIGGFLIDMKYGVMTSNRPVAADRTLIYSISFGGSISIPIKIPATSKKEKGQNEVKMYGDEDYSDALNNLFGEQDSFYLEDTSKKPAHSWSKPETNFRKETNLDESLLSAAINDIRYGQQSDEDENGHVNITDIGFIGIDTTLSLGLPKDTLGNLVSNAPGVYASLTINTIDHFYMLEAGLDIKMIQCEGVLSFMMTDVKGKDVVVPDSIQFYIRDGLKIPIVPPFLYMSGLGGGIDGLADTIGGEFDRLPPITLLLFTRLDLVELLIGDFNVSIALTGMSIDGEFALNVGGIVKTKPKDNGNTPAPSPTPTPTPTPSPGGTTGVNGAKTSEKNPANRGSFVNTVVDALLSPVTLNYGASMRWIKPVTFNGYGNVSVIGGLLSGGVSITITGDSFYGFAYLSLRIPDAIPIIGGHEVAGIEAAISDKYIGANLVVIGIRLGMIYYWNGDFNIGTGINLRGLPTVEYPEYNTNAVYATNLSKVEKSPVRMRMLKASGGLSYNFNVAGQDSIVLQIPFSALEVPTVDDIVVRNPDGTAVTLTPDDGHGGGSFLVQTNESGSWMYVSVTDSTLIKDGIWTVEVTNDGITAETFDIYGVDNIPSLTDIDVTRNGGETSYEFDVAWTLDSASEGSGYLDVYLTRDPALLDKIKVSDTEAHDIITLSRISLETLASGQQTVTIPDAMESGTYYVVAMLSNNVGGMSTIISETTFTFNNPKLPQPVKAVEIGYAGDGELYVNITDADTVDYTHYLVEIFAEDGSTLTNNVNEYAVGDTIYIGGEANLAPGGKYYVGVRTLRDEEDNFYYGTETVTSASVTMPAIDKPVLLSVDANISESTTAKDYLELTYTFDRPVWMYTDINAITLYANDFKDTWTFYADLHDGDYIVDFRAYGKSKDSVTGADFPDIANAQMGFTVDTVAPSISIRQYTYNTLEADEATLFASNAVFADASGVYTIEGITDPDAALTANGAPVTVGNNGMFTYTGKLAEGAASERILLSASDAAGNTTRLAVTAAYGSQAVIDSVEIRYNGNTIERNDDGEAVITVKNGASGTLTLVGLTRDGRTVVVEEPVWDVLYEKNLLAFENGSFVAREVGETAVKAGFEIGTVTLTDGTQKTLRCEDYVVIQIEASTKNDLLAAIVAAEEALADPKQAEPEVIAAFETAIDRARDIYTDDATPEDAYSAAAETLADETEAFNIAKVVNKDALNELIAAAEENISDPYQADEEAVQTYQDAIDAAKIVSKNDDATKEQVTAAEEAIRAATEAFDKIKIINKDELLEAIAKAEENYQNPMQAPDEAKTAYRDAIDAAIAVSIDDRASKETVDSAITALAEATAAFDAAKIVGKDGLKAVIAEAEENIKKPLDATDDEIAAYRAAIDAATAVSEDDNASVTEVEDAITALNEATEAFNEARVVPREALEAAIAAAEQNIANPMQASEAAIAAYRAAIDAAIAVRDDMEADADTIADAVTALAEATAAFDAAKIIDKEDLLTAIAKAEAEIADTGAADEEAVAAFREAIDAAIRVSENENASEAEVNGAIEALQRAAEAFDAAKNVDKSALAEAIEAAEETISDTGNATLAEAQDYRAAIDAAKDVYDDPMSAKDAVDAAVEALNAATDIFLAAKNRTPTRPVEIYQVTVEPTVNGTVSVSQKLLIEGTSLTITSTPAEHYRVASVVVNGRDLGDAEVITIPAVYEHMIVRVTFAEAWENPFVDVAEDDWFYDYVAWAHMNGIANGTSENTFSPDVALTRSMLVTFLWRAEGCPSADQSAGFADVPADAFYSDAVAWAAEKGIVMGYSEDTFGPDDKITREQIAVIMHRFAAYKGYDTAAVDTDLSGFADTDAISDFALDGMRYAVGSGLMIGRDGNLLSPLGEASRAESVTILCRFFAENK